MFSLVCVCVRAVLLANGQNVMKSPLKSPRNNEEVAKHSSCCCFKHLPGTGSSKVAETADAVRGQWGNPDWNDVEGRLFDCPHIFYSVLWPGKNRRAGLFVPV